MNNSWDNFAEEYHKLVSDSGDLYHKIYLNPLMLKLLENIENKKILDLACGNGYFSKILAEKGAIVTGTDYSKKLISIAKEDSNKNIKFFTEPSDDLYFLRNNSFDYIVSNIAFHDIKDLPGTIKECSRLLKPKSKLIFSIPHPVFSMSEKAEENNKCFRKVTRYMSISTSHHPHFKNIKCYHRPIEYYIKLLFENKFVISGFHEITTKHRRGKVIKDPKLLSHKQEIPTFLVIEATSMK